MEKNFNQSLTGWVSYVIGGMMITLTVIGLLFNGQISAGMFAGIALLLFGIGLQYILQAARIDYAGKAIRVKDLPDGVWRTVTETNSTPGSRRWYSLVTTPWEGMVPLLVVSDDRLPTQFRINRKDLPVFQALENDHDEGQPNRELA